MEYLCIVNSLTRPRGRNARKMGNLLIIGRFTGNIYVIYDILWHWGYSQNEGARTTRVEGGT
jgi:hypothetical protein